MNHYQTENSSVLFNRSTVFWSSISSGMVVATTISFLFAMLGTCIGLAFFEPNLTNLANLNIGAVVWAVITGIVSMFIGGIVTGYLLPVTENKMHAVIHSFVMWGLTLFLGLFIVVSGAGSLLGGSGELINQTINVDQQASRIAKPLAKNFSKHIEAVSGKAVKEVKKQLEQLTNDQNNDKKQQTITDIIKASSNNGENLIESVKNYLLNKKENINGELQAEAVQQITKNTSLNQEQAQQVLTNWQNKYNELVQKAEKKVNKLKVKAKKAANHAANILAAITLAALISMLLGLIATILGGLLGKSCSRKCKNIQTV